MKRVYVLDISEIVTAYENGEWKDRVARKKLQAALSKQPEPDLRLLLDRHKFKTHLFQRYLCADVETALENKKKPPFYQKTLFVGIVGAIVGSAVTAILGHILQ